MRFQDVAWVHGGNRIWHVRCRVIGSSIWTSYGFSIAAIRGGGGNTMKYILYLAWAWEILIGALLITPGGILCIACGATVEAPGYIGRPATIVLGIVAIVLG